MSQEGDPLERSIAGDATRAATHSLEGELRLIEYLYSRDPSGEFGHLLQQVLSRLVGTAKADRGFLFLREPDGALVPAGGYDSDGEPIEAVLSEAPLALAAKAADAAGPRDLVKGDEVAIGAPLRVQNHTLGCVVLVRRAQRRFADTALRLLERFASVAPELLVRTREGDARRAREAARTKMLADAKPASDFDRGGFVGESEAVERLFQLLERLAPLERFDVLIQGETGSGKELVARAIHANSPRRDGPFLAVNCAAFPSEEMLMSALFGHAKGAFTGAVQDRPGYFEAAGGGTLFLDEIGEAKANLQAALLRALQEREILRLGETAPRKVDVRVVSASHRDLSAMEARGIFRRDLLYRLNMATVAVPPLRERRADIPLLATSFAADEAKHMGAESAADAVDDAFVQGLLRRPWPGNVRELENEVRMRVAVGSVYELSPANARAASAGGGPFLPLKDQLNRTERDHVLAAIARSSMQKEAADLLGVSVRTFQRLLDKHGLSWGR